EADELLAELRRVGLEVKERDADRGTEGPEEDEAGDHPHRAVPDRAPDAPPRLAKLLALRLRRRLVDEGDAHDERQEGKTGGDEEARLQATVLRQAAAHHCDQQGRDAEGSPTA